MSIALRAVLVAAMLVGAATIGPRATAGDGITEQFFTVEFSHGRLASLTRRQVAAAFGSKLEAANVEAPKGDFDAAVDNAARQLANWNGKGSLSFCVPRVCWEVFVAQ